MIPMPSRKTVTRQTIIGEQGIALISRRCLDMGFIFHPRRVDHGIDGHIDLVDPASGVLLNHVLLVQSKAQNRPFASETEDGLHYICEQRDLDLWLSGNAPVLLILSHPNSDEAWWVEVKSAFPDALSRATRTVYVDKRTQPAICDRDARDVTVERWDLRTGPDIEDASVHSSVDLRCGREQYNFGADGCGRSSVGSLRDNRRHNLEVVKGWFGRRDRPPDVEKMAQLGDVDGLIHTLSHPDISLVFSAESALSALGEPAIPALTVALERDDKAAEHAARALSRIEPAGISALVARMPRRPRGGGGYWVYPAMDSLNDRRPGLVAILRGLRHDEETVRAWADGLVTDLDHLDADQALIDALVNDDAWVRVHAALALIYRDDDRGVDALMAGLSRKNPPRMRSDAAHALWKFMGIESLVSRLKDGGDVEGLEAILSHVSLSEEDRRALTGQREQQRGLHEELRRGYSVPGTKPLSMSAAQFDPQYAAAEALRDLRDPRAADAFLDVVSAPSYPPRVASSTLALAVDALAALKESRAVEPIKLVWHGHARANVQLASGAVKALGEIGGSSAARALAEILAAEEDRHGRIRAINALDKVVTHEIAPDLADVEPALVTILRNPGLIDVVSELDSDEAWQEESLQASQDRARKILVDLLNRLGHVEPVSVPRSSGKEPVAARADDWSKLGELVKTADIQALLSLFSIERSWEARETIMVGFREIYRQHQSAEVRRRLRPAIRQALALCRAESARNSYRANCIQAAEGLLRDLDTDT
jgi:HEAT repeat protein